MSKRKAISLLRQAIEMANGGNPENFDQWKETSLVAIRKAYGEGSKQENEFRVSLTPNTYTRISQADRVKRATEKLKAALLDLESDQPDDPEIPVGALHPWVSGPAAALWADSHHREAVEGAARSIEIHLKEKLDISGNASQLMDVFATTPPKPGSPRLRFDGFVEGTDEWKNAPPGHHGVRKGMHEEDSQPLCSWP